MPPLPPAPQILRLQLLGTQTPAKWMNGFYIRMAGIAPPSGDLNTVAAAIGGFWTTRIAPQVHTGISLTTVNLIDLSSATANTGTDSTVRNGTRAVTTQLPANAAMVVSFHIARRYRGGHPRIYLTGLASTDLASVTTWSNTIITNVQTAFTNFMTDINLYAAPASVGALQLGNLSYYLGYDRTTRRSALRPSPLFSPFDRVAVHTRLDTQRRRLGKETALV